MRRRNVEGHLTGHCARNGVTEVEGVELQLGVTVAAPRGYSSVPTSQTYAQRCEISPLTPRFSLLFRAHITRVAPTTAMQTPHTREATPPH